MTPLSRSELLRILENEFSAVSTAILSELQSADPDEPPLPRSYPNIYSAAYNLERLLSVVELAKSGNSEFSSAVHRRLEWAVAQALADCLPFVDENGCIGGADVDRVVKYYWNPELVCAGWAALRFCGEVQHRQIPELQRRMRRSAEAMAERFMLYAEGKAPAYRGLNLIFQDIAGFYKAGDYCGVREWTAAADAARDRAFARQDAEGYFPDFRDTDIDRGPSSSYHAYSLQTMIPLLFLRPDDRAAQVAARALTWRLRSMLPNGEGLDIADERERYHLSGHSPERLHFFTPLLVYSPGGRQYLSKRLMEGAKFSTDAVVQWRRFSHAMERYNPGFLEILETSGGWQLGKSEYAYRYANGKSGVSVRKPWILCGHGYLAPALPPDSMWHRDLQQHFSIFHEQAGVLLGGGNSLSQPEFSTLRTEHSHLCDSVAVQSCSPGELSLRMANCGWQVELLANVESGAIVRLVCKVMQPGKDKAWLQLPLCFYEGRERLLHGSQIVTDFQNALVSGEFKGPLTVLGNYQGNSYRCDINFNSIVEYQWPVTPVNVRQPGRTAMPHENSIMLLRFPLEQNASIAVRIELSRA